MPITSPVPMTNEASSATTVAVPGGVGAVPVRLTGVRPAGSEPPAAFTIDCGDCRHLDTSVCDDCVVSFIVGRHPEDAVVIDAGEARAVRLLEQAGLVPGVRHSRRASGQ